MFSTPTSKAGTLFDLIRSSPTTASSSYQESHENLTKSLSTLYLFDILRFGFSWIRTFAQYLQETIRHQAIRLVDDALMEQDKGACCDDSYALDCYLASLEYLLSALPMEANLDRQIGSGHRPRQTCQFDSSNQEFSCLNQEHQDSDLTSTEPPIGWWNGVWKRAGSGKARVEPNSPALVAVPSELAAQCSCGRKVLVKIPDGLLSSTPTQEHFHQPETETTRGFLTQIWAWMLAGFLWALGIINGIVIPYLVTNTIKMTVGVVVYLEKRFQIVNFLLMFIALAFIKQGDLEHLNQLFEVNNPGNHNDRRPPDDAAKPIVADNNRLANLLKSPSQPGQTFIDRGTSGSSSSKFSLTSDRTYQVNRPERRLPTWTPGTSASSTPFRTDSYCL
ncbi:hypothetical protein PSTT_01317 [Puccinia striiformis]|uniref:Uncharacterized protein n=1 Tax=Puccinia striiformis TaxID=27350 RepID=A0A2S4W3Y0_9BASI|nr:hypothetical protein PSTT_01317 [Puccinia striiformis]